ncbi:hypothetical protein NGM99_12645 [Mesorhizobium sp. RP14(2022)]|uniref:Uncharacterized protein n=1 Tax=Mesorhizobium liriopis TaxID=2953882 RepID=A0ABT1C795_9HYPH|nr:hypothetical protein [Mesorhizobium liriopis]MCO6050632.1 hypothetical protein [Mesorhizobium liriopis]
MTIPTATPLDRRAMVDNLSRQIRDHARSASRTAAYRPGIAFSGVRSVPPIAAVAQTPPAPAPAPAQQQPLRVDIVAQAKQRQTEATERAKANMRRVIGQQDGNPFLGIPNPNAADGSLAANMRRLCGLPEPERGQ